MVTFLCLIEQKNKKCLLFFVAFIATVRKNLNTNCLCFVSDKRILNKKPKNFAEVCIE